MNGSEQCGECARRELAEHTARVELEHSRLVIDDLQRKVREAEQRIKELEKKKR